MTRTAIGEHRYSAYSGALQAIIHTMMCPADRSRPLTVLGHAGAEAGRGVSVRGASGLVAVVSGAGAGVVAGGAGAGFSSTGFSSSLSGAKGDGRVLSRTIM